MTEQARVRQEQIAYYLLCAEAARLGIPTSLDAPHSPRTVAALQKAVNDVRP